MKKKSEKFRTRLEDTFIEKSKHLYPGQISYEKVHYINANTKVTLICLEHGDFVVKPSVHLHSSKCCPECSKISYKQSRSSSATLMVERFRDLHGDKYDYMDLPDYLSHTDIISVSCQRHGDFEISVNKHLIGQGCRVCGYEVSGGCGQINEKTLERMDSYPLCSLYLAELSFGDEEFIKVGITTGKVSNRLSRTKPYSYKILDVAELPLDKAYELEQLILQETERYTPKHYFGGHRECFEKEAIT